MKKLLSAIAVLLIAALAIGCKKDPVVPPTVPPAPETEPVSVSVAEFPDVSDLGEVLSFDVETLAGWEITGMPEWLTLDVESGKGTTTVKATVALNADPDNTRSAELTVTSIPETEDKLPATATVSIVQSAKTKRYIPDAAFRKYLLFDSDIFDENGNKVKEPYITVIDETSGEVELTEAGRNATYMGVISLGSDIITSVAGVEHFPMLDNLDVSGLPLTAIDVTRLPKLKRLNANTTGIAAADLTRNPELEEFYAGWSALTEINVSQNPKLRVLQINNTGVTKLDVTGNPELETLWCWTCVTRADPNDTNSEVLASIAELDLSRCTNLRSLQCGWNPFLVALDVSMLPELRQLEVYGCDLKTIDVTHNPKLADIRAMWMPDFNSIDVTRNPELVRLYLAGTKIGSIDLTQNPKLEAFTFDSTPMKSIDLSGNQGLIELVGKECALESIDLSHTPELRTLDLASSQISEIDLSNVKKLVTLNLLSTKISSLDISGFSELTTLGWTAPGVVQEHLNISGCSKLRTAQILTDKTLNAIQGGGLFLGAENANESGQYIYVPVKTIIADNIASSLMPKVYAEGNPVLETLSLQNCYMSAVELYDNPNLHKLYTNGTPATVTQSGNSTDFENIKTPRP